VWDAIFYLSFGLVVTSSVTIAGVLLVFCFLIVPALIGTLFTSRIGFALLFAWTAGAVASITGVLGSFMIDAPTGAVTVLAFAAVLILAGGARAFVTAPSEERRRNCRIGVPVSGFGLAAGIGLSGWWVIVTPSGAHPLLAAIEWASHMGRDRFLIEVGPADYVKGAVVEARHRSEVDRLYDLERRSRWQGAALTADEVRRIASMQQTLTEMGRGERFVVNHLTAR